MSHHAIKSIVFEREGSTYTATVGDFLSHETPQRSRSGKVNAYLTATRRTGSECIVRIVDDGPLYLVAYEGRGSSWANPFMVGKHGTQRVVYEAD